MLSFVFLPLNGAAGDGPAQCADLSGIEPTPQIDFSTRILPIFSACTGCHGNDGAAGLDLRPGRAYANLVGVSATTNPRWLRVAPGSPAESLLLAAINCEVTGGPDFQMPGTEPAERALIRDWIAQGAVRQPTARPVPVLTPDGLLLVLLLVVLAGLSALSRRPG